MKVLQNGFDDTSNCCVLISASALREARNKSDIDHKRKEPAEFERTRKYVAAAERREKFVAEMGQKAAHSWQVRARMAGVTVQELKPRTRSVQTRRTYVRLFAERRRVVVVYTPVQHGLKRRRQIAASDLQIFVYIFESYFYFRLAPP